jgi:hypothetical protein
MLRVHTECAGLSRATGRVRACVRAGTFVCEYAGELLTDREANERGKVIIIIYHDKNQR